MWSNGNGQSNSDYSNKDAYANSRYTIAVGELIGKVANLLLRIRFQYPCFRPSHNGSELLDAGIFSTDIVGEGGKSFNNYTSVVGGTSVTTPMVAGVVALMLEANPALTWRDVQHILVESSRKIGNSDGWFKTDANRDYNHAYGYGLVDANAAVNLAETWENVDEEVNIVTPVVR